MHALDLRLERTIDDQSVRTTFIPRDVEGLPNAEIAEALQIKLATARSRVHRARLFLRGRLAAYVGAVLEPVG